MNEQNSPKTAVESNTKKKQYSLWGIMGILLVLGALVYGCYAYTLLPGGEHRDLSNDFPLENGGLSIREVKACWKSSAGNDAMRSRTALYPEVTIELEAAPGKGRIDVLILDHLGTQKGDTHYLRYSNGQFDKKQDRVSQVEGKMAKVWLETGFDNANMLEVHRINQKESLWRVVLIHRPDGAAEPIRLGQVSIPAELNKKEAAHE